MKQLKIFTLSIICLLGSTQLSLSQVTIGSGENPVKAAILDIKSQLPDNENITSTKGGVVMPRLKLVNINTLEPFIDNSDPDIETLKGLHTGLIIYNLTDNENLSQGLYAWNGKNWDPIITGKGSTEAVNAENGLSISSHGVSVKLGGELDANTNIDQDNNPMTFNTTNGSFSVNDNDFIVKGGSTGIGKIPANDVKLDVGGDIQFNNDISVEGNTSLKNTLISNAQFTYNTSVKRKKNKYLRAINEEGQGEWMSLSGLSSPDMDPLPSDKLIFNPKTASQAEYLNTGVSVELGPGRWLVNYSVRLVMQTKPAANTAMIRPSTLRFTLLDQAGNPTSTTLSKPYEDHRIFPDTGTNACNGFIIIENNTLFDQTFYLGVRPQEIASSWPDTNLELVNATNQDAYLVALLLDDPTFD